MTIDAKRNRHDQAGKFTGHVHADPTNEFAQSSAADLADPVQQAPEVHGLTEAEFAQIGEL